MADPVVRIDGNEQKLNRAGVIESMAIGGDYKQKYKSAFIKNVPNGQEIYNQIENEFIKTERKGQKTGTTEKGGLAPIPEGKAGAGLQALKKESPEAVRNMGFARKGGAIKKQYGYMGGGKVYPQPRTARRPMSGE